VEQVVELALGLLVPVPGVLEGFDLRFANGSGTATVALGGLEEEVVVALRVEGRVEGDEIDRLGGEAVAQDVEGLKGSATLAVVEVIHPGAGV
jgi:hypothetical protein